MAESPYAQGYQPVGATPTKKPAKKKIVSPDDRNLPRATTPVRQKPVRPPTGARGPVKPLPRPVPILQNYGFHGSVDEFIHNLKQATTAHEKAYGYKPSPGLAFDLA